MSDISDNFGTVIFRIGIPSVFLRGEIATFETVWPELMVIGNDFSASTDFSDLLRRGNVYVSSVVCEVGIWA